VSPVTAVDWPHTAFKQSIAKERVVPRVSNASEWLAISILGDFFACHRLSCSTSGLG